MEEIGGQLVAIVSHFNWLKQTHNLLLNPFITNLECLVVQTLD